MRYLTGVGLFIAILPASIVASDGEAAANSGRGNAVKYHFPSIAEMRPSTPGNLAMAVASPAQLSLSWEASHAAVPSRGIVRYDVFRNGVKVAQTATTNITLDYHPSELAYEFFAVRAVDDRAIASVKTGEILAPNNAIDNPLGIDIEVKVAMGTARKFGFPGWRDTGTYFKKATYLEDYVHNWDGYVLKAKIEMSVDISLGQFNFLPTGLYTYWFMDDRHGSELRVSPTNPFLVEAPVEDPRYRPWQLWIYHRSEGEEYYQSAANPGAPSNTLRSVSQYVDQDSYRYMTWELSKEFTDADLDAKAQGWYDRALAAVADGGWNMAVKVKDGEMESFRFGGDRFAFRVANPSGEEEELGGGLYRFKVTSPGTHRIRWAEVTEPDGGRGGTAKIMEETVVVTDSAGAYTSTHLLPPPDVAGTTSIQRLTFEPRVIAAAGTNQPAQSTTRPMMQQVILPDQPVELALDGGFGRSTMAQTALWSISAISGPGAVRLVAIDPQVAEVEGLRAAIEAGTSIALGSNLIERGDWAGFVGWGGPRIVAVGVTPGTVVLEYAVQAVFENAPTKQQITLQVLPEFSLVADLDHDGKLVVGSGDVATLEHPFRFWLNDDNDTGDVKHGDFDDVSQPPGVDGQNTGNAGDSQVNGVRDLVDFFPVSLEIKELAAAFPEQAGYSYWLRHDDSMVGVVFTSLTRSQAFDYLHGPVEGLKSGFGPALAQAAGDATVTAVTTSGIELGAVAPAFQQRIQTSDGAVILVEVANATEAPLVLELRKGTDVVATVELPLKADPVESMIRYHNLRSLAHGKAIEPGNQGPNYAVPTPSDAPNDPFAEATNRKNVIFVHGYNVNGTEARGSATEVFKRLYWSGSKAKYYALLWRGDDGQGAGLAPAGADPDFHRNVGHAWQHGPQFRALLSSMTSDTAIIAHSLGNLVTQAGMVFGVDPANPSRLCNAPRPVSVKNYFAIDAALPLEALDESTITDNTASLMRHPEWAGYDQRLWPTHWYQLFTASTDARKQLTWREAFRNLDVGTNLFSSGDEVLADPVDGDIPTEDVLRNKGRHAWVVQEKLKGAAARTGNLVDGIVIQWFRSRTAGWTKNSAWNVDYDPPRDFKRERHPEEAREDRVPTWVLPLKPFFKPFRSDETRDYYPGYLGDRLIAPIGDSDANDEAQKISSRAKCLAEGIPALSYALGANTCVRFSTGAMGGSYDLNGIAFKSGWPSSRGDTDWKHSDCLNVAYMFNFKLYNKIVNDALLK